MRYFVKPEEYTSKFGQLHFCEHPVYTRCTLYIFNEKGFKFKIMPTPTSITQSCGICTRFEIEEEAEINAIIEDEIVTYKNIFRKNENGFLQIK